MSALRLCLAALCALPGIAQDAAMDPPLPGEEVLAKRPVLAPLAAFSAPVPARAKLKNGLNVRYVHRPGAPILALVFETRKGTLADPPAWPGLASLSASMLEAGSAGKSQTAMAADVDALGATLSVGAGPDATYVALSGLPSRFEDMARLLADVVYRPNLEAAEWTKLKAQRLGQLQARLADPGFAAGLVYRAALYGDSPQGRSPIGTPTSIEQASLEDVKAFLGSLRPEDSTLVLVGSVPEAEALKVLQAAFGGTWPWKGPEPRGAKAVPPAKGPRLVAVDFPGRPQTVLMVGEPAVSSASKDVLALRLLDSVLGGSFTSRLNQNLREKNGFTYGASSSFAFGTLPGPFTVHTSVKTATTGAAVAEILRELERVVKEPLSPSDLGKGKALLAYSVVETLQNANSTAMEVGDGFIHGLPVDDLATFVPRLQALSAEDVHAATRRALHPKTMTILVSGDVQAVQPQFKAAGVEVPAPRRFSPLGEER